MEDQTNITLSDLQVIVNIIDVCTKRGAFEGNELFTVGQLREKFASIIKMSTTDSSKEVKEETAE